MREIEILAELFDSVEEVHEILKKFDYKGNKRTVDVYFYDPLRSDLQMNADGKLMACCRIREKNGKGYVAYKTDHYENGKWQYSDEYETEVADASVLKEVFFRLGLRELVTVDNVKHTYVTPDYEIVIEEVKNLGNFIEVEVLHDDENLTVSDLKKKAIDFMNSLQFRFGKELNAGKPELLLKKQKAA